MYKIDSQRVLSFLYHYPEVIMNVHEHPYLRRSKRLQKKEEAIRETITKDYVEHIYTLHNVSGDLLDMSDTLDVDNLRKIICDYENIIGGLLNVS